VPGLSYTCSTIGSLLTSLRILYHPSTPDADDYG
jgi:hypothetical protein